MGASFSSEMLVPVYQFTHCIITEVGSFHWQCWDNLELSQSRQHIFSQALSTYFTFSARFSALYIHITLKAKVCMNCFEKFVFLLELKSEICH
jgi:hypothetical protein